MSKAANVALVVPRRPALACTNGQLAMALFLSTEAMFFGALVSSYFIFRWSVAHGVWPSHESVHLDVRIGWLNSVVLLASGWALSRAIGASRVDLVGQAKRWLLAAIVLATLFLAIKGYEYWEKHRAGVLSLPGENAIHEAADLDYLARLKVFFEKESLTNPPAAVDSGDELEGMSVSSDWPKFLGMLRGALVDWPARQVGRQTADPIMNRWVLMSTAHLVLPQANRQELGDFLIQHQRDIEQQFSERRQQQTQLQQTLADVQQQIAAVAQTATGDDKPQPPAELTAHAAQLTQQLTELNLELGPLADRRLLLATMSENWHEGVNHRFGLRLPQVVPSGAAWVNAYVMLTGVHALHVFAGIAVLLCLVPFRLNRSWLGTLQNIGWYWMFVDAVWFVVFPLVYLI